MWDGIYRVIGRTRKRDEEIPLELDGKTLTHSQSAELLAETFYPRDDPSSDKDVHMQERIKAEIINSNGNKDSKRDPSFTMTELLNIVKTFNPKKAPSSDGLTSDICDRAINTNLPLFLAITNKCLEIGHFPAIWKQATVVILRKPGKDTYKSPKSYRPIGLLPVLGKILEKMLVKRIRYHILPTMSIRQYGFMPQRSTEDSLYDLISHIRAELANKKLITLVSLDIEGAFDSAWWPKIRTRLADEHCPINLRLLIDSYLNNRSVSVRYAGVEHTRNTYKGCVQGSIGGPLLWNILLDPLLKQLDRLDVHVQAFADDIILAFSGDTAAKVQTIANKVLDLVWNWGETNKLKFAPHKTNAMVITRKLKYDTPRLSMGGTVINTTKAIKILGLTIDDKLTFNTHIDNIRKKVIGIYKQLTRAAKITWGLHPEVLRTIYIATIEPIILYGASAWAEAVDKKGIAKKLDAIQRGFVQKICKSYRTVSLHSALTLTGLLPLDIRVKEASTLYKTKKGIPLPDLGGRKIEIKATATSAPHPAEQTGLEFLSLDSQQYHDETSKYDICIFTDGSKIDGKVGASLSVWKGMAEARAVKLSLPSYCTVYQAELLAICEATKAALRQKQETTVAILSDSMAALQTVTNINTLHPLAIQSRNNIHSMHQQDKSCTLYWIKAHAGLDGNERADTLAKEAALKSKKAHNYDRCPISYVKRTIRANSLKEWSYRYTNGETASITKLFLPEVANNYSIIRKIKPSGTLTQVLTGHGGFSEYLHRFGCKENPSCICQPNTDETIIHVLLDCPVYMNDRYNAENEIGIKIGINTLGELMSSKHVSKFLEFCKKVANKVILKNK